jgi:hypothetical protein
MTAGAAAAAIRRGPARLQAAAADRPSEPTRSPAETSAIVAAESTAMPLSLESHWWQWHDDLESRITRHFRAEPERGVKRVSLPPVVERHLHQIESRGDAEADDGASGAPRMPMKVRW